MFHIVAWYQSADLAGALTAINAVREEMIFTNGPDIRVPTDMPFLIGAAGAVNDASVSRAQLQSPSLRIQANLDIEPVVAAATFGEPPEQSFWPLSPVALVADEALNFAFQADPAAPVAHYGLAWFSDGPQPETPGPLFTVRATATVAQSVSAWINGNLTFAQTLPAGRYAVVGMRCRTTDGIAARLVFPAQFNRPGVICVNAIGEEDCYFQRFGRMGVWGEFPHTNPPTLDVLGGTAAAQTVFLDLVKTA